MLSKGHGETALYAILADCGYFPGEWLETRYRRGDFFLGGHPDIHIPGVEATTGSTRARLKYCRWHFSGI